MFLRFDLLLSRLESQLLLLIIFLLLNGVAVFRLSSVWKDCGEHSSLSHLSTLLPILYQVWYWQFIFSIPHSFLSFCPLWLPPLINIVWTLFPSNVFFFYLFLSIIFLFSSKKLIDWEHFFYFLGNQFFFQ